MRKIFSSHRLENAEAVARLLEAEGIEVRIENGRALHRAIRGNFSYRDDGKSSSPQPTVWVIRSDDQPHARALMREAGLLQDTTRITDGQRFVPATRTAEHSKKRISRLRYGLLGLALIVVLVNFMRRPAEVTVMADTSPAPTLTMLDETHIDNEDTYVIATPPLLAVMLARRILETHPSAVLCLAIDGQDPAETALAALASEGIKVETISACSSESALYLDTHRYTTDGSGTGTVLVTQRAGTRDAAYTKELAVRRSGHEWTVVMSADNAR